MKPDAILHPRPEGLYCAAGEFFIDPVRPVERALITHGHGDHARPGHAAVMATRQTLDIMAIRYGAGFARTEQTIGYGEAVDMNGVSVIFHPAGHVLGSAQIEIRAEGLSLVVSGDYRRGANPTCAGFEPVPCDIFVTEATFGLPVFHHPDPLVEIARLLVSIEDQPDRAHLIGAYALGKAQRVIRLLRDAGHDRPIYLHGAMRRLCDYYVSQGIDLGPLDDATKDDANPADFAGAVIVAPPSAFGGRWAQRFPEPVLCFASGWMQIRARARARGVELPLVLSDHCDWPELTATLGELSPSEVWVTHGREEAVVRWCELNGIAARPLHLVGYEDEAE